MLTFFLIRIIIVSVIILGIVIGVIFISRTINNNIYDKRAERCLKPYKDSKKIINFKSIKKSYFNPFFKKELYYTIKDYYVLSSYKSYMPCGHTNDIVSYNALRDNILLGARFIHLDVFYKGDSQFDENATPIVANIIDDEINYLDKTPEDLQFLNLEYCFDLINKLAWKKCDYPLFLYLDMKYKVSPIIDNLIFQKIMMTLSDRFVTKKYSFQRFPPDKRGLGDMPIHEAMNTVIFLSNRIPLDPLLNELINGIVSLNNNGVLNFELTDDDVQYGDIKSKFITKSNALLATKYNLTMVYKKSKFDPDNKYVPKSNSENWDTSSSFDLGLNFVALNLQNFPGQNDYTKKYLERFKNGSFILKPNNLIAFPKPKTQPRKQCKALSYAPEKQGGLGGFYGYEI